MGERLASGNEVLDSLLEGGLEQDTITTVYGPAGSGKTNVCLLFSINTIKKGKKVIYLDSEGNFSVDRFRQLTPDYKEQLKDILFLKPNTFAEQKRNILSLKKSVDNEIGLIIVDTIAMLYRLEFGKDTNMQELNRELGKQISFLSEIARTRKIPVLITNQVYSDMDTDTGVKMLGGGLLKYGSKCLVELKKGTGSNRIMIIKKHRSIREGKEALFTIVETGFASMMPDNYKKIEKR
ncbi:MAG: DNA repair and recombination protein RadB [DPANN group archaeon]|nr:DNA repair and recombination protein RadB [DPANN group archaeon]